MTEKRINKALTAVLAVFAVIVAVFAAMPSVRTEAATVKLNRTKKTLYVGRTQQLKLKNYKKTPVWTSSDPAVAEVSSDGLVTALKKGTAQITATTAKGARYTCEITVRNPHVNPKKVTLTEGETLRLTMTGATPVSYSSSAKAYAKVSKKGVVTAVAAREKAVTIKVRCDNGHTYKCRVTVVADTSGSGGSGGSGGSDSGGSGSAGGGKKEYYGIREKKEKTAYRKEYVFETPVTTTLQMVNYSREALLGGAESFTVRCTDPEKWAGVFDDLWRSYSVLAGFGNRYSYRYIPGKELTVSMTYKDGWKAVVLLEHTGYTADATVRKLLDTATGIVNDAVAYSSDLKKQLRYINDRLCAMAEYDSSASGSVIQVIDGVERVAPAHDATGVLLKGAGVCESYTCAYQLCLEILGVENHVMVNKSGSHVWNRVKVSGRWYHVDVTWNDTTDDAFFLLSDDEFIEQTRLTGNAVDGHTWYKEYLPE